MVVLRFLSFALILHFSFVQASKKLKVSIYYQSFDANSAEFIRNQLQPNYNDFKDYIKVDFVPYGFEEASREWNEHGVPTWYFHCPLGGKQCEANRIQACAIHQTKNTSEKVDFISCMMDFKEYTDATAENCSKKSKISWKKINKCAEPRSEGDKYIVQAGLITNVLIVKGQLKHLPTIVFNDKYNEDLQDSSVKDFKKTLCEVLQNKPATCNALY